MTKMRIVLIALMLTVGMALISADFYFKQIPIANVPTTITDTIGPYFVGGYDWVAVHTVADLETSTTLTLTLTPMAKFADGVYKDLAAASTVASAITADDDDLITVFRSGDSTKLAAPAIWLKRVTTVTGDSVTIRQNIFAK